MRTSKHHSTGLTVTLAALFILLSLAGSVATIQAQDPAPDPDQERIRTQQRLQDGEGDQVRLQLREGMGAGIETEPGLTARERQTLHTNLERCLALDISESDLQTLFPMEGQQQRLSVQTRLRLQNRVMATADKGLPVEPMLAKIQEGRTKGVPEPALERACERMENHLRTAQRVMIRAREAGIDPAGDPVQERRMTREMSQQMWRGMNEEGLDHLCDQARLRLRDGSCSLDDLTAASETATRLHEEGIATDRAVHVVGEALRRGYGTHEMHQLRFMVTARHQQGGPIDGFLADMEYCLGEGMGSQEMYRHMWQNGWMGPGDMHGPGGCNNIDDVGHGGPAHHGGMGDDDHHGGMDDDDHHGGMGG